MTPIAVAIVNYNTREHLRACLRTVQVESSWEIIVVDNGSSDGSAEMVRAEYPGVTLHVDASNPGYGAGANEAIQRCSAPYILLLNSDTLLRPGALQALSDYLDLHPRAGIVGPRLLNPDHTLQPSCHEFPTPLITLLEYKSLDRLIRHLPFLGDRYLGSWSHEHARVVPWVLGAVLAIRREAFEAVGGFDESYYMYYEEVDLCYRLKVAGWETHFAPVTNVVHVGGVSTIQRRTDMAAQLFLSSLTFYQRHHFRFRLAQAMLLVRLGMVGRLARDTLRYHITRDPSRRSDLAKDLAAWRRVLLATPK